MKKNISIKILLMVLYVILTSCSVANKDTAEEKPFIKISSNQNYCQGAYTFDVIYPDNMKGSKHSFTLFQIKDKSIVMEGYLVRDPMVGGSHLCLSESFLGSGVIMISYGYFECSNGRYDYYLKDFSGIVGAGRLEIPAQKNKHTHGCH